MLDVTDDDPRAVPVYATAGKRGAGCVFGARLWRGGKIGGGETETQKYPSVIDAICLGLLGSWESGEDVS